MPWCLWQIVGCERRGKGGTESWKSRRKEYLRPRETEGTTARFRETIHRRIEKERWAYCWPWPLSFSLQHHLATEAKPFRSSSIYVYNNVPLKTYISSAKLCHICMLATISTMLNNNCWWWLWFKFRFFLSMLPCVELKGVVCKFHNFRGRNDIYQNCDEKKRGRKMVWIWG